jgi:hypothetical protein
VFFELFHLMCHLFKSDKERISKIQRQRFFVSHPVSHPTNQFFTKFQIKPIKSKYIGKIIKIPSCFSLNDFLDVTCVQKYL